MAVENRERVATTPARETAVDCVEAGIEAATPERAVEDGVAVADETLTVADQAYDLASFSRILLVGAGKGAGRLAAALVDELDDAVDDGVVVSDEPADAGPVSVVVGDHPVPSERGADGARRVRECVEGASADDLVVVALTGGASALLPAPAPPLTLADVREVTRELLDAGATVDELNAVRKHCSTLKGGQLVRAATPATVLTLALSDVVGDDPSVIGSGPTVGDETTFADALDVVDRYGVDVPPVRDRLERGVGGEVPETPKPGEATFDRTAYHLLANAHTALSAAAETAREQGYRAMVLSASVEGEAREAGRFHAAIAREVHETGQPAEPPVVLLSGGECTVTVRGDGTGGPNLEFALAAGLTLRGAEDVAVAAVDTDGRDGSTDVAGALVDGGTADDPGVALEALDANDSLGFLDSRSATLRTGPTGTNVNDLRVVVVEGPGT
ncbi:glycerate kinase type-2 family protein [Haloarchaeobius sp. HRN-SO-5]|uniref:glycerate kinase type-2 family protein n=1 Tax=Haloarchaeobius sp. HRN-SO-5 TaxID=3446118 RepID=UPI003EBB5138